MLKKTFIILTILSLYSCNNEYDPVYRQRMRIFVEAISTYAKDLHPGFIVIPQNGHELVTSNGEADDPLQYDYLAAIDGAGQEDLFYGYSADDYETDKEDTDYLLRYLDIIETNGIEVLVTDYCSSEEKIDISYSVNAEKGYISFAASERELNVIPGYPGVYNENAEDISTLSDAMNFLYLINPDHYGSITAFTSVLALTNYDLLIIDLFHNEMELSSSEISQLKIKANGARRLVICYMSIGEAEDYRYYWKSEWEKDPPAWLEKENPVWKGNYKVQYWDPEWQAIILGEPESYLDKIINAGFDGVYLDIIEAFEYFE